MGIEIDYGNKWLNIVLIYKACNNISREILEYYVEQINEKKNYNGTF